MPRRPSARAIVTTAAARIRSTATTVALAGVAVALCAPPTLAKDAVAWSKAGPWVISMNSGDNCSAATMFTGGWVFGASITVERKVLSLIAGPVPYRVGDSPNLRIDIDGTIYSGGDSLVSQISDGKRVITLLSSEVLTKLETAKSLKVYDGNTTIIGFDLPSMTAALAELRRCQRELIKLDTGSGLPALTNPVPLNLTTLVTESDYPDRSRRASESGRTRVALTVTAHGLVSDCSVTASSGSVDLDDATCRVMRSRAKFKPGLDSAKRATQARFETSILWQIPND